ncbi:hypothetical protein GQX74_002300 [Glossina fuscipes]|nr:hypothetical protein GQX74_002300 [Glossina fuscipes]
MTFRALRNMVKPRMQWINNTTIQCNFNRQDLAHYKCVTGIAGHAFAERTSLQLNWSYAPKVGGSIVQKSPQYNQVGKSKPGYDCGRDIQRSTRIFRCMAVDEEQSALLTHSGLQFGGIPINSFKQLQEGFSPLARHSEFAPQGDGWQGSFSLFDNSGKTKDKANFKLE